jgi:hypothetical protein
VTSRLARGWALLAALVVLAAGLVFTRALGTRTNYDEGVYLASLAAMRRGQALGSELYTSQPPVFYWLLRVLAAPFGSSIPNIRLAFALPRAAPWPWAAGAGAILALAVLTKLLAAPFAVPFVALVLAARAGRRLLPPALLGVALATSLVLVANIGAIGDIWRQVVTDHTEARSLGTFSGNVDQITTLFEPRTPFAWLVPLGLLAFVLSRPARATWPLWTFVPAAIGFLVFVRPLTDHHLVLLSVACAISAGPSLALAIGGLRRVPQVGATAALVLFGGAGLYQEQRRLHRNDLPDPPEVTWAVEAIARATSPDALVVTDLPIVLFRTGRPTVGSLVDISNTRVSGGTLTADEVNAEIRRTNPEAVLVGRMLKFLPPVVSELERRYRFSVRCGSATLYLATRTSTPPCPR